jgi:hypothetical protein
MSTVDLVVKQGHGQNACAEVALCCKRCARRMVVPGVDIIVVADLKRPDRRLSLLVLNLTTR